jgi:membrane protein required for colicin V production
VNIADTVLVGVLCLFGLRGLFKGFFRETFSLLGLIAGFMVGSRYDEPAAALLPAAAVGQLPPFVVKAISFVAVFLAVYLVFCLIGWLLHRTASFLLLQSLDRAGGFFVGAGKGVAVLGLLVFLLSSFPPLSEPVISRIDQSYFARSFYRAVEQVVQAGKAHSSLTDFHRNERPS